MRRQSLSLPNVLSITARQCIENAREGVLACKEDCGLFLALHSPRAADGLPCEGVHSPFRRPRADPTSDRHVDASELICSKSKDPRPNLMKLAVVLSRL